MTENLLKGFAPVEMQEAAFILGGVDKRAQDALYTIGYVLGIVARLFAKIISWI
ncbi:MAG: hypothetical protein KBS72_00485 [Bacteroidales bacterium]|nr:hypothetical protein [Candidatus Cacconaster scatequi]